MDMLDQALDSNSQDKTNESTTSDDTAQIHGDDGSVEEPGDDRSSTAGLLESGVPYPFRSENSQGAVTFRVVQVTQGGGDGSDAATAQVITTSAFTGQQGVQTVITSPFSNGGSPTGDGQSGEARFTYFPAVATSDTGAEGAAAAAALATTPTGQFYVMMSPQDVLAGGQRTLAPRSQFSPKVDGSRTVRDERRRATHNEVERRRRDKINNWIVKLSKIVPDCSQDHTKQGQVIRSKGGILAKACEYIQDLRNSNARLGESLKENERLSLDVELLRQQCEELKSENAVLRTHLQQHGIAVRVVDHPSKGPHGYNSLESHY